MTSGETCRDVRRQPRGRRVLWAVAVLSIYLAGTILFALNTPFPTEFDELAHLSYIKAMVDAPSLFAHHESLRLLDIGGLDAWSETHNYLSHPSLYYLMMSPLVGGPIGPSDLVVLRLVDVGFGLLAIALVMGALWNRVEHDAAFAAGTALMAFCPMVSVVCASIGNDALTVVAGALALVACLRLAERGPGAAAGCLAGAAFALAALTKLNAGLLIGVMILVVHAVAVRHVSWRDRRWRGHGAIVLVFGLVGVAPYIVNLLRYGAPIYVDLGFHVAQIAGPDPWPFARYAVWFAGTMARTWSAYEPADPVEIGGLVLLLALALLAWRSAARPASRWIAGAALVAIAVMLPLHLAFAYQLHVDTLHLSAAQSRYYLAMVPVLAFAAATGLDNVKSASWRRSWAGVTVAVSLYASLIPAAVRTYLDWQG